MHTERVNFLDLFFDRLTFHQVKGRLQAVTCDIPYTYVVTPNVDHVVRVSREPALRELYNRASLCLCDSRVLRLLARLRGIALSLVPGSDLVAALFAEVIEPGDRIAIVGSTVERIEQLRRDFPRVEFVHHAPPMDLGENPSARRQAAAFITSANARFALIAVGSPQQEMIASEVRQLHRGRGMALCIGASLDFLTGEQKRAPRPLQRLGLEWAHRLASNPKRLWRRYLVDGLRIFPIWFRWRKPFGWKAVGAAALLLATLVAVIVRGTTVTNDNGEPMPLPPLSGPAVSSASITIALPPPNLLRPLTPDQAAQENAERPFVTRPDTPASKFVLRTDAADEARALNCLTQAVYYEAASEGVDGGRAVAQVVLNRMHHAGFPASVCGVVYQGADRGTGCQFTFTCDGSLLRTPVASLWARSRKIAEQALAGSVFAPVGHATHYHADYVLPYWADSLDKTVQIGRHIFYRLRSSLGDSRSFFQRYAGTEPQVPKPGSTVVLPATAETEQLATALISDGDHGAAKEVEKAAPAASPPAIDSSHGALIADTQVAVVTPHSSKPLVECPSSNERHELAPLGANDMRLRTTASGC